MADVVAFKEGGYRFIRAGMPFSSGVAAEPGYEIERVRLVDPIPLEEGYRTVEMHLRSLGRPSTALAACELRSATPFTEQGFFDFNSAYVKVLARWGLYRDDVNPVARTNVCPEYGKPEQPVLYAFSSTVPARDAKRGSFIIAGGAEVRGGVDGYAARTVRYGDTSPEAMKEKVKFVVGLMEQRLALRPAAGGRAGTGDGRARGGARDQSLATLGRPSRRRPPRVKMPATTKVTRRRS